MSLMSVRACRHLRVASPPANLYMQKLVCKRVTCTPPERPKAQKQTLMIDKALEFTEAGNLKFWVSEGKPPPKDLYTSWWNLIFADFSVSCGEIIGLVCGVRDLVQRDASLSSCFLLALGPRLLAEKTNTVHAKQGRRN